MPTSDLTPTRAPHPLDHLLARVRAFEREVVAPAVAAFAASRAADLHRIELTAGRHGDGAAQRIVDLLLDPAASDGYRPGAVMVAVARDALRRIPAGHGVFAWTVEYQLTATDLRARPAAAYRLAREGEVRRHAASGPDHPLRDLTCAALKAQLAAAFWAYDRDADRR
jgi:hypothetical protein